MASQPLQPPIEARVDRDGRLVAADTPLLALQEQAGSRLGNPLALPQLAAIARLAMRLGVAISRPAVVASESEDIDLWIRAEPDGEGVTLTAERWTARAPSRSRWSGEGEARADETAGASEDLLTDAELRIVQVSPGLVRRLGVAADNAIGRPLARLLRPIEDEEGNLPLLAALAGRAAFSNQLAVMRGSDEEVRLDGEPRLEDDRFAGYAVRIRAPAAVAAPLASLPLDDLLREPLTSIIGQAQEIAARSEGPLRSDYAGYGADIAAAARHLMGLLAAISSETGSGDEPSEGETLDLAELLLDAAALVQPQASERAVMLDIGGVARLPARGQPRAVTQILVNLIGNAVRFSPEGASVAVTLEANGQAAVVVSDSGPGVAPADRHRIFERFEQAGPKAGSAGLGLAISRRLAREMGGDVELLDSPAGATFRLRLPPA